MVPPHIIPFDQELHAAEMTNAWEMLIGTNARVLHAALEREGAARLPATAAQAVRDAELVTEASLARVDLHTSRMATQGRAHARMCSQRMARSTHGQIWKGISTFDHPRARSVQVARLEGVAIPPRAGQDRHQRWCRLISHGILVVADVV